MPPPVYVHVETTVEELRPYAPEALENVTEDGLNQCRSFIRNLCIKNGSAYKMTAYEWRALVCHFYDDPSVILTRVIRVNDFTLACHLEGVKVNSEGYPRLKLIGGVKARKAIKAGQWHVPVFDEIRDLLNDS